MSLESPDRSFIIQELVNVASEVKKISHSQGVELSSPLAMSRALIGWGKIYLDESLITMGRREQVLTIDDYLEEMGPLQTEQFALGLSFGFLASAISSIETGENHLERFYPTL